MNKRTFFIILGGLFFLSIDAVLGDASAPICTLIFCGIVGISHYVAPHIRTTY